MNLTEVQIFKGLNESQKLAVRTNDRPLLIVAGPGTGKTLTVVRKMAYLMHQDVRPESILAVTFTNRAAREMKERAETLLGKTASKLFVSTFHLLGLRIIQESRGVDFSIYSRDEQIELLKSLTKSPAKKAQQMAEEISRMKNFSDAADEEARDIYDTYQAALQQKNALDFDDLIRIPIELLESNDEVRRKYQEWFRYIIVDEYQDINPAQYRLLRLLAVSVCNVCAVGDSDQAIYAFRGADIQNFLNFERDFPGAARIPLTENYRSTGVILNAADEVIKNNQKRIDKGLIPTRDRGVPVTVLTAPDERAEGAAIIREIEERMGGTSRYQMMHGNPRTADSERSFRFADFAVVFRTNGQAKILEEIFAASGIPYQMIGHKSSVQSKEIAETLTYLKSFIHSDDPAKPGPIDAQETKLLSQADFFDPRADAVTLMTLHMAKGLEFPVVFITGCEDGLIPCTIIKDGVDLEEERRLFYVGMTRAKDELFLLRARNRFLYGQRLTSAPSPFLAEIPGILLQCTVVPDKVRKQKEPDRQMGLF